MDLTSVEDLLLTLLKYPLLGVQIIGYVPLTITQTPVQTPSKIKSTPRYTKSLQFRWLRTSVLSQLVLLVLFSAFSYLVIAPDQQTDAFDQYNKLSTDLVIVSVISFLSLTNTMGNRIYGYFTVRRTLAFWQMHCHQLQKIANIWSHPEFTNLFRKQVRVQFCWTIFFLHLPISTTLFGDLILTKVFGFPSKTSVFKIMQTENFALFWGLVFWIYLTYSHILLSNWITFFVKIYNLVLKCVIKEVEKIAKSNDAAAGNYAHDFVTLDKIEEVTRAYDVISGLVDYFNEKLSVRLVGEVWICIIWILGCIYFSIVSYKMAEIGSMLTNMFAAGMTMRTLYTYGDEGENLEQNRILLIKRLCDVNNLGKVGTKKLKFLNRKVINCKLSISPGNFFTLNRSFVLSIWSVLITLIIVMAQVRDSDEMGMPNAKSGEISNFNASKK
ncbi:hypothetical protein Fcan01_10788 [Folsomia candida]|uniref:Gustatory receptor n=1 Tax=Folsomia candida TaxID=158441 RepID=A0A226EAQ6_FOLCA|nr:hypothetical protein Fcan01_10788 [Folsomia candida]